MADAAQYFSADLTLGATGDLQIADSVLLSQQAILRRLLTNPGDYIWEPTYGAGLPSYIGKAVDIPAMKTLITTQMFLETSVVQNPAPQILVDPLPNGMYVRVQYVETDSGLPTVLSFNVTP